MTGTSTTSTAATITIWYTWNTSGTTTTATDGVWVPWCDGTAASSATTYSINPVWKTWSDSTSETNNCVYRISAPPITSEQIAREREQAKRREEEYRRRCENERRLRIAAEKRAADLLRELLNPQQRAEYDERSRFYLRTASGRRYEVDCKQKMHNVFEVDAAGNRIEEHCIYASGDVPLPDNAAAQLLLLRANEDEFRRIANQRRLTA